MDKKNITPEQNQPINRITSGQLPAELAELSEEILQDESFAPALEAQSSQDLCTCGCCFVLVLSIVTTQSRQMILPPIKTILKHGFLLATEPDLPR
ncbi:MAG: microcyclamide/patellamide family RiPP [Moorea sp. SIO1G6]|nr:microcyclamide/patellamide family RiPP [Moorena sp. SIO2B7]NET65381.1 microcyclamide/patellamide family RiPP [Moorena sp. SIO1G6]